MTIEPNIPGITKNADGVLSILDKIATLRISLLLFSLALAAEITLLQNGLGGFLYFQWDLIKDSLSMGPVILFLIGYALFMSIGVSIIKHIAEAIFFTPAYKLAHSGRADGNAWFENPAPSFKVSSTALRAYALREKDAVAMKVYNDSVLERNESFKEIEEIARLSLSCSILMIINVFSGLESSLCYLYKNYTTVWGLFFIVVVLIIPVIWFVAFSRSTTRGNNHWIDCPHLAQMISESKHQ